MGEGDWVPEAIRLGEDYRGWVWWYCPRSHIVNYARWECVCGCTERVYRHQGRMRYCAACGAPFGGWSGPDDHVGIALDYSYQVIDK